MHSPNERSGRVVPQYTASRVDVAGAGVWRRLGEVPTTSVVRCANVEVANNSTRGACPVAERRRHGVRGLSARPYAYRDQYWARLSEAQHNVKVVAIEYDRTLFGRPRKFSSTREGLE